MKPRSKAQPWLMLAPTLVGLGTFFVLPVALALYRSFFAFDLLTPPTFVGAGNYARLWESGELVAITLRTGAYSLIVVTGAVALGLALALALGRPGKVFALLRGCVFSAYVVSWVSVALLWMGILEADRGVVAAASRALGLGGFDGLSSPKTALVTVALVSVWKVTGYAMILFLAGLEAVPASVREAAALDGAGPVATFAHVTWPLLRPTTVFVASTSLILSFQAFDVVRIMTQGGPVRATSLFVYAIYEQVFVNLRVGRASALAVVLFAVLLALTAVQLFAFRGGAKLGAEK